jgi:hypothetical protein
MTATLVTFTFMTTCTMDHTTGEGTYLMEGSLKLGRISAVVLAIFVVYADVR